MLPGGQTFVFTSTPTNNWYDPPVAYGYRFTMTGSSKFTAIADFPVGVSPTNSFTVSTGSQKVGDYGPGQRTDFVALMGAGVSSFVVSGIVPYKDSSDVLAFPIKLDFDTPTADFTMMPLPVPDGALIPASAGQVQFSWSTEPELRYQVQWSPNLVDWNDDGSLLQGTGVVMSVLRTLSTDPKRFWRAQIK